jgi:hypothetical protein
MACTNARPSSSTGPARDEVVTKEESESPHERRIARVEPTLRGLYDGAIQIIAVCERACGQERDESEPCYDRYDS